jgi:hypothetical protein
VLRGAVISGAHSIIYSQEPEQLRTFLGDVLGLDSVDAGGGWLIFALPPAELAVHPTDGAGHHELYLICDDLETTTAALRARGVEFGPTSEERWGLVTSMRLPGGGELGLYQPRHPRPAAAGGRQVKEG